MKIPGLLDPRRALICLGSRVARVCVLGWVGVLGWILGTLSALAIGCSESDLGPTDSSIEDSSSIDSGSFDEPVLDSSSADSSSPDPGPPDSSSLDSSSLDSSSLDSSSLDSSSLDSSSLDSSSLDSDAATRRCATCGYSHFVMPNRPDLALPNSARYRVEGATVVDEISGLVWQRSGPNRQMEWTAAIEYCDALVLGGRDDFRMPSRLEWVSIVDAYRSPALAAEFLDARADYHWTASQPAEFPQSAYSVYLGAGETTYSLIESGAAYVRCVAGTIGESGFVLESNEVRDRATGLVWQREVEGASSWDTARARCAELGMRLPSARELQTIVDEGRYRPAIDEAFFPATPSEPFWTLTPRETERWTVEFRDGQTFADHDPSDSAYFRCVR